MTIPIGTVYGVALNHGDAIAALGAALRAPPYGSPPQAPVLYIKPANTWHRDGSEVVLPRRVPEVAVGAALGLVFGSDACRVPESSAFAHVAGFVPVLDLHVPHDDYFRPNIRNRCQDFFCPIGDELVRRDAVADPDSIEIRTYVNAELRQCVRVRDFVRRPRRLIADVSEFMTLAAGDLLLAGIGWDPPRARPGDSIAVEVDGCGRLERRLIAGLDP